MFSLELNNSRKRIALATDDRHAPCRDIVTDSLHFNPPVALGSIEPNDDACPDCGLLLAEILASSVSATLLCDPSEHAPVILPIARWLLRELSEMYNSWSDCLLASMKNRRKYK